MKNQSRQELLSQLPQIDRVLQLSEIQQLPYPRGLITDVIRHQISRVRNQLLSGKLENFEMEQFIGQIKTNLREIVAPSLRRSVNAAGIVLHTNMGRAPLSRAAQMALRDVAENYANLEIDLESGKRGSRYTHVEDLICRLTGAEAAMVVNNNAAATLLVLNTLAFEKACLISRGELITIGDSFRLPEIMQRGGARMVEVGSTNQTHLSDYETAITEEAALIMKVHTSNYKIIGFTSEASLEELVQLGKDKNLMVYHDVGSGALVDLSLYGLPKEPVIQESLHRGADVVSFSGDKLIGGPQSGIIVGKNEFIQRMKKNQLTRALRAGKLTYAALEATLKLFLDEEKLISNHAVLGLLTKPISEIKKQARKIRRGLRSVPLQIKIEDGLSEIGGGSLATESLPTVVITISAEKFTAEQLARKLRENQPPIIGRVQNNQLKLDLRTVRADETDLIIKALQKLFE